MAQPKPQSFDNHVRIVPAYHGVVFPILTINLLWSVYRAVQDFSAESVVSLLLGIALLILFFFARVFALTVQDRVIRLEMRVRLGSLLPADLQPRIPELTVRQLVALRFASDEELPDLARRVLTENITDSKAIKQMIQNWNADYLRV